MENHSTYGVGEFRDIYAGINPNNLKAEIIGAGLREGASHNYTLYVLAKLYVLLNDLKIKIIGENVLSRSIDRRDIAQDTSNGQVYFVEGLP